MSKSHLWALGALMCASSFTVYAQGSSYLDLRFELDASAGNAPCYVTQPIVLDLGKISHEGKHFVDATLSVKCEDEETSFFLMADEMSAGSYIYSDEYVTVYAGSSTMSSSDSGLRFNGLYTSDRAGCTWASNGAAHTWPINIAGEEIYPIGGRIDTGTAPHQNNRNSCIVRGEPSPTGDYSIEMRGIVMVHQMPSGDDDDMPFQIIVPLTLTPWVPVS